MPVLAMVLQGLASAASSVMSTIGSVLKGAFDFVSGMVKSAFSGAMGLIEKGVGFLAGAIQGFVSVLKSSIDALLGFAKSVRQISNRSGASIGQALNMTNRFNAMGVAPQETSKIFGSIGMNPTLFNQRAAALGAPKYDDPDLGPKLAAIYQAEAKKGTQQLMAVQSRIAALFGGEIPDAIMQMLNTDPKKLREELDYNKGVQEKLGLDSSGIKAATEDFPLLINRVMSFVDAVKMRFVAELLPTLQDAFSVVSSLFMDNAGGIASSLSSFAKWMYEEMPGMALNAIGVMIDVGESLVNTFFSIGDSIVALLRGLDGKQGALYSILAMGAGFIDFILNFGTDLAAGVATTQAMINNVLYDIQESSPLMKKAFDFMGLKFEQQNPIQAAKEVYEERGKSDLVGTLNKTIDSRVFAKTADNLEGGINKARGAAQAAFGSARGLKDGADKALESARERRHKEQVQAVKETTNAVKDTAASSPTPASYAHMAASVAMRTRRRGTA